MGMHHGTLNHMANKEKMLVASAFEIQHILGSLCPRLGTCAHSEAALRAGRMTTP